MSTYDHRVYPTHRIYPILAGAGVVVALLFVPALVRAFDWPAFFFCLLAVVFALINLRWMRIRAELTPSGLTIHDPLRPPAHLDFRQMVAAYEAGQIVPGVSLVYYPLDDKGLVDMENPRTLFLPAVEKQDELLGVLQREMPQ